MERNVLKEIIERHQHYLNEDVEGWEAMRADLRDAVLSDADLSGAVLRDADLSCADLSCADLSCADLSDADLRGADLHGADLRGADLRGAVLRGADLHGADLSCADLSGAVLRGADLRDADLNCADLSCADLRDAVLRGADLRDADLRGADLSDDEEYRRGVILSESIIGWKKCKDAMGDDVYVELEIPKGAIVFSINGKRCRTNKCKVISISNGDIAYSDDNTFTYEVGKEYEINKFNLMYNIECGSGIHFFKTIEEAEKY